MDAGAWDQRYASADLIWSAGPNATVADRVRALPPRRALDVGCGEGRNAIWLADQGWVVTGVDFSPVAIDKARAAARRQGVDVDLRVGDVTDPTALPGPVDLVLIAYLHLPGPAFEGVLARAAELLAPGGRLLVLGHHVENLERGVGGPPDPAVLQDPARIAEVARAAGLEVREAGEVLRQVGGGTDEDGHTAGADEPRTAIDSLVIARRPTR